jgi:hypothetical protein
MLRLSDNNQTGPCTTRGKFRGFLPIDKFGSTRKSPRSQSRSMTPESKKNKRLVALFLFGFVLLNYPILSLLNLKIFVFGLPLQFLYIFCIWGLLILLAAWVTMHRSMEDSDHLE